MTQHTDDVRETVARAFSAIDLDVPVDRVIARGRGRRRRRYALVCGAAAMAVAAAVAVPLAMGDHGGEQVAAGDYGGDGRVVAPIAASPSPVVRLAAWTVHSNGDGTVSVIIREARDLGGLSAALAKAGVPAAVSASGSADLANFGCSGESTGPSTGGAPLKSGYVTAWGQPDPRDPQGISIRPSAIPKGSTVAFAVGTENGKLTTGVGIQGQDASFCH